MVTFHCLSLQHRQRRAVVLCRPLEPMLPRPPQLDEVPGPAVGHPRLRHPRQDGPNLHRSRHQRRGSRIMVTLSKNQLFHSQKLTVKWINYLDNKRSYPKTTLDGSPIGKHVFKILTGMRFWLHSFRANISPRSMRVREVCLCVAQHSTNTCFSMAVMSRLRKYTSFCNSACPDLLEPTRSYWW